VSDRLRLAFFGSPAYALPSLDRLAREHEVVLVVAQPDAPAGRGMALRPPPVAARAQELDLPLAQPARIRRDDAFEARFADLAPDVAVTVAYGQILPQRLLDVPRHGFLNAHASLLPAWRGAAPVQWALVHGDRTTGVTVMQTEAGLDTGPIRHVLTTDVAPDETARELFPRLAELSAQALSEALRALVRGELPSHPQDDAAATQAPLLRKEDGDVRWSDDAQQVVDRWRGVIVWPGSRFRHAGRPVRADVVELAHADARRGDPGEVLHIGEAGIEVACGSGSVRLARVTPPGKPGMPAADWARGARLAKGDRLA
jgi:methionyl-tRNA formyltransferase